MKKTFKKITKVIDFCAFLIIIKYVSDIKNERKKAYDQ
ncbi:hypothetical protein SMU86_04146 [Streptococcus mutans U2A]|nr:hypothetical protein SMU86_04146 [Streptococcus mutans U2A]